MADKIFISYTSRDREWAHWIGVTLRDHGFEPLVHEWQIGAGENIARWMDENIAVARRLLGIFTDSYTKAIFSSSERWSAYWDDPEGRNGFLVPVEVERVSNWPPLVRALRRCSLVGLSENDAERELLTFLSPPSAPLSRPPFPGTGGSGPKSSGGRSLDAVNGKSAFGTAVDQGEPLPPDRPPWPRQPRITPIPSQVTVPFFYVEDRGKIDLVEATDIDEEGNDATRIEQLLPIARRMAADLTHGLSANVFPELSRSVRDYERALSANRIRWAEVFALGEQLHSAAVASDREIVDRLRPELEDWQKAALDSLVRLHGPLILSSRVGLELSAQADAFRMSRDDLDRLQVAIISVGRELQSNPEIATSGATEEIISATRNLNYGVHPERNAVYTIATLRNLTVVLVGAATLSVPLVAGILGGISGAIAGSAITLVGAEAIKKSTAFVSLATQLGAKLDKMTNFQLRDWLNRKIHDATPFRNFILKNEQALRRISDTTTELNWMSNYIDFIKNEIEE
jgi:hypothetical protein